MYRIIIILVLLIILFFMVRKAFREFWGKKENPSLPSKDMMVQDPVCKTYITAGTAVTEKVGGQTYFFCSQDCAGKFKDYLEN